MITVTSSKILVEEVKIKRVRAIHIPGQSAAAEWDITYKILQVGPEIPKGWEMVQVGLTPIFSQYVQFASVKVLEKTQAKTVVHVIVDVTDVIAIDDNEEEVVVDTVDETAINVVDETIVGDDSHLGEPDKEIFVDTTNNAPEEDIQTDNSTTI